MYNHTRGPVTKLRAAESRQVIGTSTCKQVVARLKQVGMRCNETGMDAMMALRCHVLNWRLEELYPKPTISFDWRQVA